MDARPNRTWQDVRDAIMRRIRAGEWAPGARIPNEADLAAEAGVARPTMNRALRDLARTGVLERRRKGGTRVAREPVRKATLDIPVIRREIEDAGGAYSYRLLERGVGAAPGDVRACLKLEPGIALLHLRAVHRSGARVHVLEERWIVPAHTPGVLEADFSTISANEWLVANVPFSDGEIVFRAVGAGPGEAGALAVAEGVPLFRIERTTWNAGWPVTHVRLSYPGDYRLRTTL